MKKDIYSNNEYGSDPLSDIIPPNKIWFTAGEIAKLIGRSSQFVRQAIASGAILAFKFCSKGKDESKLRVHYQVHKDSLNLYLLETLTFEQSDFMKKIENLIVKKASYKDIDRLIKKLESMKN